MAGSKQPTSAQAAALRGKAEAALATRRPEGLPEDETNPVLHELRVHQVELEMQNEELRRTQVELDAQRARYFDLYNLAPVGYLTLNQRGLILEANLTASRLLGLPVSALVKRPISQFVFKEDQDVYYRAWKQFLDTATSWEEELRLVKKDGTPCWVQLMATAANADGVTTCRIALNDISARKQLETERAKLEVQFQQAQKLGLVGRLAGGVAHDFNNMLGVILGHAEMAIRELAPNQPLHANLAAIQQAATHSADLTRQLLTLARKQIIAPKVLDLNETLADNLGMLQRLLGENIKFSFRPGQGLWAVKMDPTQVAQILANLCVNARDAFVDVGKVDIATGNAVFTEAACVDHPGFMPGEYVRIAVSDNGCGMDAATMASIFEPFFTTKGVGMSVGLGLSVVMGAVTQNHGFIKVESEPGQGTTFSIYLPRHLTGEVEPRPTAGAKAAAAGGQETILLVEDEPPLLGMITKVLAGLGYTVLAAPTPGQAISLAREHAGKIHLLMTDVVMPEMNGRELARHLLASSPELKRLFMSGYSAEVIADHGVLGNGVHFIQKPFSLAALTATVRAALDEK